MIAHVLSSLAAAFAMGGTPGAAPSNGIQQDPMGPIANVTAQWRHYQPATTFCIKQDVTGYTPGGDGATDTGADPICQRSGFAPTATGLTKIHLRTPTLCGGCRRLFIDFSKIPATNSPPIAYAHGHAYYRLQSLNPFYTVSPVDHSPNTKDFYDDKLVTPDGSPQQPIVAGFELHALDFVTDTAHFIHTASQGPYYIGPWYFNRRFQKVNGLYLDVDVVDAQQLPGGLQVNGIGYSAGFNSGQFCPNDDDLFYAGCFDWGGASAEMVDPAVGG